MQSTMISISKFRMIACSDMDTGKYAVPNDISSFSHGGKAYVNLCIILGGHIIIKIEKPWYSVFYKICLIFFVY
jgi:hypothetical protein